MDSPRVRVHFEKVTAISRVCEAVARGSLDDAREILGLDYPFDPGAVAPRKYGPVEATRVFIRDGFVDRYSGQPLLFPPVLRVLSNVLPAEFPFHPNWKTEVTHPAYWELGATVDHLVPVTLGGADEESNWVTTSMSRNSAKMNWTLDQLGWQLFPPGEFTEWDGMISWFLDYLNVNPELLINRSVRQWHRAAKDALDRRI